MTKRIQSIMLSLMALALTFTFSSCSDDDDDGAIWDIGGFCIHLDIQDSDGNSLLTTDAPGSVVGESITLDYKDREYNIDWSKLGYQIPDSRYVWVVFEGLRYFPVYKADESGLLHETEERIIRIGELPLSTSYEETIILHYNGYNHIINVKNTVRWIKRPKDSVYSKDFKRVPDITTVVTFDGMIIKEPYNIVIKKDK